MARERFSPDAFAEDINELGDLTDALCIVTDARDDSRRDEAMRALTNVIAQRIDALYGAVQEARA